MSLENIFLMRGCFLWHADVSTGSSLLSDLRNPSALVQRDRHREGWVLRGGYWQSFRLISSLPSLPGLPGRQYRNETLLNLHRTKEYIPRIPLGQAALHTGNTSLLYPCEQTTNIILMSFLSNFKKCTRFTGHKSGLPGYSSLSNLTKQRQRQNPGVK